MESSQHVGKIVLEVDALAGEIPETRAAEAAG
jgi:hypothetical protein